MEIKIDSFRNDVVKSIIPGIKFTFNLRNNDQSDRDSNKVFLQAIINIFFHGQPLLVSEPILLCQGFNFGDWIQVDTFIPMPRYILNHIESVRVDDLPLDIVVLGIISSQQKDQDKRINFNQVEIRYSFKQSAKEWNDILSKLGYQESWIFELSRTQLDGMDVVAGHLNNANDCLISKSYGECMKHVRVAWDSFIPLFRAKWDKVKVLIDMDSQGQLNHKSKSERIEEIVEKVSYFANVGVHLEAYKISPDDAILIYYQTMSMMSYLSRLLNRCSL